MRWKCTTGRLLKVELGQVLPIPNENQNPNWNLKEAQSSQVKSKAKPSKSKSKSCKSKSKSCKSKPKSIDVHILPTVLVGSAVPVDPVVLVFPAGVKVNLCNSISNGLKKIIFCLMNIKTHILVSNKNFKLKNGLIYHSYTQSISYSYRYEGGKIIYTYNGKDYDTKEKMEDAIQRDYPDKIFTFGGDNNNNGKKRKIDISRWKGNNTFSNKIFDEIWANYNYDKDKAKNFKVMKNKFFNEQNKYRVAHRVKKLKKSEELERKAQAYAEVIARLGRLEHDPKNREEGTGENLAYGTTFIGHLAVKGWYDEIGLYNFNKPGFSPATGHFTQLVWKGTTHAGFGVVEKGDRVYVVCKYSPPGNYPGEYETNVLQRRHYRTFSDVMAQVRRDRDEYFKRLTRKPPVIQKTRTPRRGPSHVRTTRRPRIPKRPVSRFTKRPGPTAKPSIRTPSPPKITGRPAPRPPSNRIDPKYIPSAAEVDKLYPFDVNKEKLKDSSGPFSEKVYDEVWKGYDFRSDFKTGYIDMRNRILEETNRYRRAHNVQPLTYDLDLEKAAQEYAKYLGDRDLFEHDKRNREKGWGENLAKMSASIGSLATKKWYDEVKMHDFGKNQFSFGTGHFTALVWKDTTKVGCGIYLKTGDLYVVCKYTPAGNVYNKFDQNVFPRRGQ
uniref:SCP domain-containing protein n=2 Tax=Strongyloides stercoralis TaxID=6248 RepID=A0AAF5I0I2_STRER